MVSLPGLLGPDARLQILPSWLPLCGGQQAANFRIFLLQFLGGLKCLTPWVARCNQVLEPVALAVVLLCAGVSLSFALRIACKAEICVWDQGWLPRRLAQ